MAPISSPPALPPWATMPSGRAIFWRTNSSAQAMKSVNVFIFDSMRAASCHVSPNSPPPRMWAMAYTTPRSTRLKRLALKVANDGMPYEP